MYDWVSMSIKWFMLTTGVYIIGVNIIKVIEKKMFMVETNYSQKVQHKQDMARVDISVQTNLAKSLETNV